MRILVYGAGNIGSLYAGLLQAAGEDVSILARGTRLAGIRDHGIQLENVVTGEQDAVPRWRRWVCFSTLGVTH